jgi:hypothetical protein
MSSHFDLKGIIPGRIIEIICCRSMSVNLKNGKMISEVLLLMITCILIPVSSTEGRVE